MCIKIGNKTIAEIGSNARTLLDPVLGVVLSCHYLVYYILMASVAEWLAVNLESLAPHCCVFESRQGHWILSCEKAIQLAYRTAVVLLRYTLVPDIMHQGALEVFLHQ